MTCPELLELSDEDLLQSLRNEKTAQAGWAAKFSEWQRRSTNEFNAKMMKYVVRSFWACAAACVISLVGLVYALVRR